MRQTLPKPKRSGSILLSLSLRHSSTWNCRRTDKMIPTYIELSTDRTFVHNTNLRANCDPHESLDSLQETPRETPCKRLLARDSSRETSQGGPRTQQPTRRRHTLNNQMITHGSMSFGVANKCDARDKNKIATIGTRRRSRRSRRGQDCDARNKDKIATLATMTDRYDVLQQTQKKLSRGHDRNARDEEKVASLATRTRSRHSRR